MFISLRLSFVDGHCLETLQQMEVREWENEGERTKYGNRKSEGGKGDREMRKEWIGQNRESGGERQRTW